MFDPSTVTLGQLSSAVRDWAIVGTLAAIVWKIRGVYAKVENFFDDAKVFVDRVSTHMTRMESFSDKALNNHLAHMQHDLRVLSGRKADVIEVDDSVGTTDMPGTGLHQED